MHGCQVLNPRIIQKESHPNKCDQSGLGWSCIISYFPIIVSVESGTISRVASKDSAGFISNSTVLTQLQQKLKINHASHKMHPLNRTQQTEEFLKFYSSFQPTNCSFESWFDIINNWCCIKLHQRKIGSLGLSYSKCVRCGEQQRRESLFVLNPPETSSCSPLSWSRGWRLLAGASHASLIRINRITQHKVLT